MKWALFLFLLSLPALAAEEPAPVPCGPWYARLGRSAKNTVVGAARGARDSAVELKSNVKQEGPLRILVRKRTEEEKALGYREYFISSPKEKPAPRYLITKALAGLQKLNPFRKFTPTRGVVQSLDRLFLRNYTATNGIRGTATLAGGLGASIVITDLLYEKPMAYLEATIPFERAVREGLDTEYAYRTLRDKVAKGELTREKAMSLVAEDYRARARYFDLVRMSIEEKKPSSMEEIAADFYPLLNSPALGGSLKDLRLFLSDGFAKNPAFIHPENAGPITMEQYKQLFALNHTKLYATASLAEWLEPGFKKETLAAGTAPRAIFEELTQDPFRQKLIAYQRAHAKEISPATLSAWLAEDLEWATRLASLEVLNSGVRDGPNGKKLNLGDRRASFLRDKKLILP